LSRYFSFLLVAVLAISIAACGDDNDNGSTAVTPAPEPAAQSQATPESELSNPLMVVATTAQIGALVHEIAGDHVVLHVLMGAGVDPHDYEMTPGDLRTVGEADLILKNGIGLDDFLDSNIDAAGGNAEIVTVTEGIRLIEGGHDHGHDEDDDHGHTDDDDHGHSDEDDDHGHDEDEDDDHGHTDDDDHGHGEYDPHVWHNPANAKVMVDNIVDALSHADGSRADLFQANGEAYKTVLDDTNAEIRALIDEIPEENRKLVSTHDAFGYFVHAYGIGFIGAVIPGVSTDAEPSARDIAALSDLIERENVRAIFTEQTVDPRIAEQLARDTGVEIVYGLHSDSLGEPGSGEDTIHGMLLANATKISEALK
jgi:zinc/manganese transport system substrate-binding protein